MKIYSALLIFLILAVVQRTTSYVNLKSKVNTHTQFQKHGEFAKLSPNYKQPQLLKLFPDPSILPTFTQAVSLNLVQAIILKTTKQKFLTDEGLLHSTALGIGLWTFLGFQGWLVCVIYLALGNLVTKVKMAEKERLGIAEKRGGARGPENVWGAAATAMICAMLTYFLPEYTELLKVGYVASLSTKLSDTFQSEIGKAYGKTTYLITTFKSVPRGTEGAVSLEGTVAGIVGSLLLTTAGYALGVINTPISFVACIIAAMVATTVESYIGATVQQKVGGWVTNELVNFINTLIGAVVGIAIAQFVRI